MSSGDRAAIRSYQRIFKPDRRVYQVEGHRLPVPGGVPLAWLAYAVGTLLAVLLLGSRSLALAVALAAVAAACGLAHGGRVAAAVAGAAVLGGSQVVGWLLALLDWPMRLLVVPALAATLATRATPDGRPAHRFALSWFALLLRPGRRSLARPLKAVGATRAVGARVWVAADERSPRLHPGVVHGPATVCLREEGALTRARGRRGRLTLARDTTRGGERVRVVELGAGERLRVRP